MPDETTARRIYAQAISSRRRLPRRRLTLVAAAAVCAAIAAAALAGAFRSSTTEINRQSGQAKGDRLFIMVPSIKYTRAGGELTSIAATINDDHFSAAALNIEVLHTDVPLSELQGTNPETQLVFSEQTPMTATGSTTPDTAWWTWSGTISPSDWSGGCTDGSYGIRFAVATAGTSIADAFASGTGTDRTGIAWFRCNSS
ncbi:MAG: hypothetical protein ACRDLM_11490 [Gaiellaceae bacterium]